MANVTTTLKSVLSSLGYPVYQDKVTLAPENTPVSYLVYRKIAESNLMTHQGRADLNKSRFQITHVAETSANRATMVNAVWSALAGNTTNFEASMATDIHLEDKEADKVYTAIKDYYIWYTE